MTLTPLLSLAVAGVAATSIAVFALGVYLVRAEQPVPTDLSAAQQTTPRRRRTGKGPLTAVAELLGRPLAPLILRLLGSSGVAKQRRRISAAGRPKSMTVDVYAIRKGGFFALFGITAILLFMQGMLFIGTLLLVFGWFWPDLWLLAQSRARQFEIERTLPDFLDVLTVTVSAGLGFRNALERVCDSMPGALEEEFRTAMRQMDVGTSRRDAFEELRDRNSCEALSQFVTALLQAEELGAPLSQALVEIAEDVRREAAQSARRKAAKITPRVTLVVSTVMVPGVMVLLVGALFFSQRESFSGILG